MALPANFLEELRARLPPSAVIGRRVRLLRSGKQWKGCCPFHGEKTPSFYVYDDGYHCFGCGAHGDVITFTMQSQGLGFMEAVEQLAAEAGLQVPKPTPEAAAAEKRRLDTIGVLEAAQRHYLRRLGLPEGRAARDYLIGRGLTEETIARYGLGWAGERGALTAELKREGIEPAQLEEAGLLRRDEDDSRTFELFGQRVMFPIRDRRGMIVSFGGRILGSGQPKYVNGPETPVFSKRRTLFGLDHARGAVRNGGVLVVVEGYMDVIAAAQAGFGGAVAPLGTALTNEQLEELWRISACPYLCFDGDAAGIRAARRALELALPQLTAERTIKLVTLPPGDDPDSLMRKGGPREFQKYLDVAKGPTDSLFDILWGDVKGDTPEQRALLSSRLMDAASRVSDKSLAWEYRRELQAKLKAARPRQLPQSGRTKSGLRQSAGGSAKWQFPRPSLDGASPDPERIRILFAVLLRHPKLLPGLTEAFQLVPLIGRPELLRQCVIEWVLSRQEYESAELVAHLDDAGFRPEVERILAREPLPLPYFAAPAAMPAEAEAGWRHTFDILMGQQVEEDVALARMEAARDFTNRQQNRLVALSKVFGRVRRGELEPGEADETD